ncbi:MAG: glycine--tRNA ligase subunit beta [Candidatus Midichloria sp.]|nr:glycine--tRNA ligase subunit beta [Candidatus Midichloria sp.]
MEVDKFLLEIFSEEIPASMQNSIAETLFKEVINTIGNIFKTIKLSGRYFSTPRRTGFFIENLPTLTPSFTEEIRGPRINSTEQAIEGFLKKYQISSKEHLEERGDFYFWVNKQENKKITDILPKIIQEHISTLIWPKSMRWADHEIKWVRPIHNILCLLGDQIIEVNFGHIKSNNYTYGHRFMAPEKIIIQNVDAYEDALRKAFVEIWPQNRKKTITENLSNQASTLGVSLINDQNLLEEVSGLVEWPVPSIGEIDKKFLPLPKEVLITTLKNNQKYFLFEDSEGNLAPFFGIVANVIIENNNQTIIKSNQRVVAARLSDAAFFFNNDKKATLISRVIRLKNLLFHNKIGTVYDKVQSTKVIAIRIAEQLNFHTEKVIFAVELMKADLLTDMVKEFPELQGIMGYYYALNDGEDIEVANAIKNQYKPKGPSDSVPTEPISIVVALAEKLDTLNQMFLHNIKPTGSKDPFALRRAAIGVLMILNQNNIALDFNKLELRQDVIDFIYQRKFVLAV